MFSYSFVTGNDEPIRDPWLWQLWGSPNNVDWAGGREPVEGLGDD